MPRKMSESSVGLSEAVMRSLIRVTPCSGGSILDQGSGRAGPWQGFEVGGGEGRTCLARVGELCQPYHGHSPLAPKGAPFAHCTRR